MNEIISINNGGDSLRNTEIKKIEDLTNEPRVCPILVFAGVVCRQQIQRPCADFF